MVQTSDAAHSRQLNPKSMYTGVRRNATLNPGHKGFIMAAHVKAHRNQEAIDALDQDERLFALANGKADELAKAARIQCHDQPTHQQSKNLADAIDRQSRICLTLAAVLKQFPKECKKGRLLVLTQEQKEERRQAKKEETKVRKARELQVKQTHNWICRNQLWVCRKCMKYQDGRIVLDALPRDRCEAPAHLQALAKDDNNYTILVAAVCTDAAGSQKVPLGPVAFCNKCGQFSQLRLNKLGLPCEGPPTASQSRGQYNLNNFWNQRRPNNSRVPLRCIRPIEKHLILELDESNASAPAKAGDVQEADHMPGSSARPLAPQPIAGNGVLEKAAKRRMFLALEEASTRSPSPTI